MAGVEVAAETALATGAVVAAGTVVPAGRRLGVDVAPPPQAVAAMRNTASATINIAVLLTDPRIHLSVAGWLGGTLAFGLLIFSFLASSEPLLPVSVVLHNYL